MKIRDGSLDHIDNILNEIIKSESYFFPAVPMVFERNGLNAFVPDDGSEHKLNWKSLILQYHISLLEVIGWDSLNKNKSKMGMINSTSDEFDRFNESIGSVAKNIGKSLYTTGSIRMRQQSKCIASLRERPTRSPSGYGMNRLSGVQYETAPGLNRGEQTIKRDFSSCNLETNPIFDFQINCSFESIVFKSIVLAINAHGLLNRALGYLLKNELHKNFLDVGIKLSDCNDPSPAFEEYYSKLMNTLLTQEEEAEIVNRISKDDIATVLNKIESLNTTDGVPHAISFIESIVAPLCYHEKASLAARATKLYTSIVNGHNWDIQTTEVITLDNKITFKNSEHVVLISAPCKCGNAIAAINQKEFKPSSCGFYDFCYANITDVGTYEIDKTMESGRFIVLPQSARKEIIHELPLFDQEKEINFSELIPKLQKLVESGTTAIHIPGTIVRNALHNLTSVTDHTIISNKCGGSEGFKDFCERAKALNLCVLIDFLPVVSILYGSRKYTQYCTRIINRKGREEIAEIPNSDSMLMNYRSLKFWNLLSDELVELCDKYKISGFYLGSIDQWDTVYPRNLNELNRIDPDGNDHYQVTNIIEGSIINIDESKQCGLSKRDIESSPFLISLMKKLWNKNPDAFVWMDCEPKIEPFVIKSGIIPSNTEFIDILSNSIKNSVNNENVDAIDSNAELSKIYEKRNQRNPKGSFIIAPFGSLTTNPFSDLTPDGLSLALNGLFFLSDVPLLSGCLDYSICAYDAYNVKNTNVQKPYKWYPNNTAFTNILINCSSARTKTDWALGGDIHILPVSYDSNPMRAILAVARICKNTNKCALICTSFYKYQLIYEVGVIGLPIFDLYPSDSVVEIRPTLDTNAPRTYYSIKEVTTNESSLFLDIKPFTTTIYEIDIIPPPIPPNIMRTLMNDVYHRLENAIQYDSNTVLSNNSIFHSILNMIDKEPTDEELSKFVSYFPTKEKSHITFREALVYATRRCFENGKVSVIEDENIIEQREKLAMKLVHRIAESKLEYMFKFGSKTLKSNNFGPILFVAPELGPFSKVGGLSTMVWELAKELVQLGLDIHVISPYYNVSPKGETDYLKKYGVEYVQTIDVYAPNQIKVGIHYGVVDGVKCWFIHHYSFFATPYQTGSCQFRLQLLVLMAKASLELCCQVHIIPSIIITNDWMTGLTPAIARYQFGDVFNGTIFLHIFHNLGVGYAGKIWPPNGDTGSLSYIHQLPDEVIVDSFDHSFDPSLCALMKCNQWATVSKRYREELLESSPYKYYLKMFPKPFAYSNGIRLQERLDSLKKLGLTHEEAKRKVQEKYFGKADDSKCLFVFVGRIVEQKGVYLIVDSFEELHRQYGGKLQFIVGGQAAADDHAYGLPCTRRMWDLKQRYPEHFWADPSQFFSDGLLACHGADFTMVPSLFEPSGIVQQEAFASGCPVIAFRTGGLADTVFEFDREKQTGNGLVFWDHHHKDFVMAMQRAVDIFMDKALYAKLRQNAFNSVLSTTTVATAWSREFARLLNKIFEKKEQSTK